ncbi:hypothetical protein [Streptomyces sp. Agncl-13]|uniref:hypothetical protein n=1 Tax=Streptomyces sp. Agncl-13 TaxID=3400628 RepID=UPI003A8AD9DA
MAHGAGTRSRTRNTAIGTTTEADPLAEEEFHGIEDGPGEGDSPLNSRASADR